MTENSADLREWIERVKDKLEIEAVVGRRVQLQRRSGRLWGLCPFHPEKTPSFTVSPERGFFKCFGCGKGGDALTFVQELEGLSFWEALRQLADEAGVEIPRRLGGAEAGTVAQRDLARQALTLARKHYHEALARPDARPALEYLKGRAVSAASVQAFGIGWAPNEPGWLWQRLRAAGIPAAAAVEAGLVYDAEGGGMRDRFFERVMFPVADAAGRVVGFGGRYLPGSRAEDKGLGKYVNSPESPVFQKRRLLYALDRLPAALRADAVAPILLCEGFLDVVMLHQGGFATAVAALGTAFTEENARRLRRLDRAVVLVLDPDPAGRRAAARAAQLLLAEGVDTRVAELPEDIDPADMVSQGRVPELRERLAGARDILAWRLAAWAEKTDIRVAAVKARAAREMAEWVALIPDPVLAEQWSEQACDALGLTREAFRRLLQSLPAGAPSLATGAQGPAAGVQSPASGHGLGAGHRPAAGAGAAPGAPPAGYAPAPSAAQLLSENEREMVAAVLGDPSLYSRYRAELEQTPFQDARAARVLKWCRQRREGGAEWDLAAAMEAFAEDPLLPWLDGMRLLPLGEPDHVLQSALRAHRGNLDRVYREERKPGASDQDLARWHTPGLRSASQNRR